MQSRAKKSILGFTLIELLVAIAIFSVIGTVLFVQIHMVTKAKARVEEHAIELAHLQKAMQIIGQDLEQMVQRPHRNESGETELALAGERDRIEFVRTGWTIPPAVKNPRSELQRIHYTIEANQLVRSYWLYVDSANTSQIKKLVLLKDIQSFTLRYWYRPAGQTELKYSDSWPLDELHEHFSKEEWPVMIECEFTTGYFGTITRLFQLTQSASWSASNASGS